MQSNNFYNWMRKKRTESAAMDSDFGSDILADLENHDKRFHPNGYKDGSKCKYRDNLKVDQLDASETVKAKGTVEELASIAQGESHGRLKPVSVSEIPTVVGNTNSRYRDIRNRCFQDIERRRLAGEKNLDGSYPISDPSHKVQHMGADGKMYDGFANGFQVSFQTTNGEGFNPGGKARMMSDEEYDRTVEDLKKETGSEPYVGVFGGIPEISFRCDSLKQALDIARRYN